jgi:hypothetical protein
MDNPDPTKFITIEDHKAALVFQQAAFDEISNRQAASLAEKDMVLGSANARLTELETLKSTMESKVTAALQSGDPQQFISVATEFCDPVAAKRQQLEASIASAQAELNSLN